MRKDFKDLWAQVPKTQDEAIAAGLDDFVAMGTHTAGLMNAVIDEMGIAGHTIFAEDSQTLENNLFQLFVTEEEALAAAATATGVTPRAVMLASHGFKSWHFTFEKRDDFVDFVAEFLSPIKSMWAKKKAQPKATTERGGETK